MSLLENFKAFNFNEGVPYVSVTSNGMTFNKSVIMKLGYPEHVLLLARQLVVWLEDGKVVYCCASAELFLPFLHFLSMPALHASVINA